MKEFRRYYWDSGVFCSFLSEEENRWQIVEDLLKEGHAGRLEIVTSSFALVEVLKLKGHTPINAAAEDELKTFFEYPFIKFVNADRDICEAARAFVWKHKMASKDALHMATAHRASTVLQIHGLFSWDSDFVRLSGKQRIGFPISHPFLEQGVLRLENGEESQADPVEDDQTEEPPAAS